MGKISYNGKMEKRKQGEDDVKSRFEAKMGEGENRGWKK